MMVCAHRIYRPCGYDPFDDAYFNLYSVSIFLFTEDEGDHGGTSSRLFIIC